LVVPLALTLAAVLVDEIAFLLAAGALAGIFLAAGAFFVVAVFLAGTALVADLAAGLVAGFELALEVEVFVVFALGAAVFVVAGFALGLEAARGAFLVVGALEAVAFLVDIAGFLVVVVAVFLDAMGAWFSLVSAVFLEASFTFPDGPFGSEKTLVSAPRAIARLMLVICEGVISILYCSSRNFLIIGRETPERASSG